MTQVKIFRDTNCKDLQDSINDWFKTDGVGSEFQSAIQSEDESGITVTVFYKTDTINEKAASLIGRVRSQNVGGL